MTVKDIKGQIESGVISDDVIIFKISDNDFIPVQYINAIASLRGQDIVYIDSIEDALGDAFSIFEEVPVNDTLRVLRATPLEISPTALNGISNLMIITEKFSDKDAEEALSPYIVEIPKLTDWQLQDYVYSLGDGADTTDLDLVFNLYKKDTYRLEQEISKISIFNQNERKYLLKDLIREGAFSDATNYNIFNLTNAILKADINSIKSIYAELGKMDVSGFGLHTILLKNFRNLIMVKMTTNPTPENTGLDSKQLYAVKNMTTPYNFEKIVRVFEMLSDIDRQIKTGELPTELMIDYMLVKILTM